jgi:D-arabinonate dehydratase
MRIKTINTYKVTVPLNNPVIFATRKVYAREFTVVKIETDENIDGWGITWWHHPAEIIDHYIKSLIIGEDPFLYERIWNKMYAQLYRERRGSAISAISAVDIAIWDIISKYYNKPLYKVLGGYREEVSCYISDGYYREKKGIEDLLEEIKQYLKMGFNSIKIKVGKLKLEDESERVKQVRDFIGPKRDLMVDANNGYSRIDALKIGKTFENLDVKWFEEPLNPDDLDGMSELRKKLRVPIAAGELDYLRYSFRDLIIRGSVDIIQPDVCFVGGITEFIKISSLASSFNVSVSPHAQHNIHTQLCAALPNCLTIEYFMKESDIQKDMYLYKMDIKPENGHLKPLNKPGVGIEIDESKLNEYNAMNFRELSDIGL